MKNVLVVIEQQQVSTFDDAGKIQDMTYTFSRNTRAGVSFTQIPQFPCIDVDFFFVPFGNRQRR